MAVQPILIAGEWASSSGKTSFQPTNPRTKEPIAESYPVSPWEEVEAAVRASAAAFDAMREVSPEQRALFLETYAGRIEARAEQIAAKAHEETALPVDPRLAKAELPRTTNQLRQAAAAARERSWSLPTIDTATNIRSMLAPIGPVCVFGPNNFPLAFNGIAGGDFAAALAAGNPVIAKANTGHPGTSLLLAEAAHEAAQEVGMPPGFVQLLYRLDHTDGERLVGHPLLGATAYTGSRAAGLALKRAADAAGKPIYLELSSINPVVILPGALRERLDGIVEEFQTSCLMGTGQFCTNPGLVLLLDGDESEGFVQAVARRFDAAPVGTLLGAGVAQALARSIDTLTGAGAELVTGGSPARGAGFCFANTLLRISGRKFIEQAEVLQTEAFGNASLLVICRDLEDLRCVAGSLEGNLTGCVYSHRGGEDDAAYRAVAPLLRQKVGRLLDDKMPTGVAVVSAMNHGGPFPATGHPGFTAVGIPASLRRFAMLQCYDNVRPHRLPPELRDQNHPARPWRLVDGQWTRDSGQTPAQPSITRGERKG